MIYFDNAATSRYKPREVKKAVLDSIDHSANPGRASHDEAIRGAMTVERARSALLRYVGAKRANVIFTKNCTEALNLAILGTARPGIHVVTTVLEHNSVLRPLSMLKKEGLISLTIVQGDKGKITAADIEESITNKTYLVAVTAMSNVTGYVPPLEEIGEVCARRGVKLLVDGAQAIGHLPISFDKIGIDLLCGAGHKSLHGIMGSGYLIYSKRIFVNPLMYGGTGTESASLIQPKEPPESLESGTLALPAIAALEAGVNWTEKHDKEIIARCRMISDYLHESISALGIPLYSVKGSPLVTFDLPFSDSQTVSDILNQEYGICLRSGLHCAPLIHKTLDTEKRGLVRVSIGYDNTMREAKRLVYAIEDTIQRLTT